MPVPQSLLVAIEARHVTEVTRWWDGLTAEEQHELLDDAANQPSQIATQTDFEELEAEEPNAWYAYIVNQEMRFYFDRPNGCQTSHGYIVYPMLTAISAAADANVVSYLLTRKSL